MHDKQRAKAKARCKVDTATFKCESCGILLYEGTLESRYKKMCMKYGAEYEVIKGKIELDHKIPVVEVKKGFCDWNTYIERLYVGPEDYQGLCRTCHAEKSKKEVEERAEAGTLKRKK